VNAPTLATDPPTVLTTTFFAPAVPAGTFAEIERAVATTLVAALPSTVTAAPAKFAPVIVIVVPPTNGPALGETLAIVGADT
jgi:hypothetical protein